MATNKRPLKVFLCYAREDADSVHILYDRLRHNGLDMWMDKVRLFPGQKWESEIRRAVLDSDIVIVCLNKQFSQKGIHHKEVKIALEKAESFPEGTIFIIPARLENCDLLDGLQDLEPVDLFENPPIPAEDGYEKLLMSLRRRAHDIDAILRVKRSRSLKTPSPQSRSERLVPEDIVRDWLIRHDIVVNPFGNTDIKSYSWYPEGAVRPDQWEFLLDPIPLFVHCPTSEDAQMLAYLL
ncbi:toll/interleukin-1 receptor domain-containing protein, partial [Candidatus Woesearchaeota archaeon]|nr:toll/interleukin-1 receptor domain-containing protein [Candidatus Woesearchaeota archaeon]